MVNEQFKAEVNDDPHNKAMDDSHGTIQLESQNEQNESRPSTSTSPIMDQPPMGSYALQKNHSDDTTGHEQEKQGSVSGRMSPTAAIELLRSMPSSSRDLKLARRLVEPYRYGRRGNRILSSPIKRNSRFKPECKSSPTEQMNFNKKRPADDEDAVSPHNMKMAEAQVLQIHSTPPY